ncbi:hypothetical protein B0H13DRAFT_1858588 [Mycena leptocephala]|nr:hypothetical protein B0H13DRAFT_1858588 [Mycena leptocephala]
MCVSWGRRQGADEAIVKNSSILRTTRNKEHENSQPESEENTPRKDIDKTRRKTENKINKQAIVQAAPTRSSGIQDSHLTELHFHLRALPFTLGHKHTPISVPPSACNAGTRLRGKLYPLVSTQRLHGGEGYAVIHVIGYYGPHVRCEKICLLEPTSRHPLRHYLLAVLLLIEHTHPHSTARTAVPIFAPPACTAPAPLGHAHSPLPLARMLVLHPHHTRPLRPASTPADIQQHAYAHYDLPECGENGCRPTSSAQAPLPAHKPSPADERAHTRPCCSRLESRMRERKAGVKGPRAEQGTRNEEMERRGRRRTHPAPPSLLFLPTDVQRAPAHPTHPEQLLRHLKRIHNKTRDGDARARHRCESVTRTASGDNSPRESGEWREIDSGRVEQEDVEVGGRIKQRSGRRGYAGQSQKGKRAARSAERGGVNDEPAACGVQRHSYTSHGKGTHDYARIARTETRTPGTGKSAPHAELPKRARVLRRKVGGHGHKEGEPRLPACVTPPALAMGSSNARQAVVARTGERLEGGGEEGEEGENSMILTSIPNNQTIATPAPPVLTDARCAQEFGGEFRRRYCGGKKRAAEALPPAHGLAPCPQRGGWQRTSEKPRIHHLDAPCITDIVAAAEVDR